MRADASMAIGTGHVMRCLALAQALAEQGHEASLAACEIPDALTTRLEREGVPVTKLAAERASQEDLDATLRIAGETGATCLVLDGYSFGRDYQDRLRKAACLCVIDDCAAADGYSADLLLNPNLFATDDMYAEQDVAQVLTGAKYAVLRREFWQQTDKPVSSKTRRILITMGGSDPDNDTGKVIRAVKKVSLEHVEIRAIVGAGNPYGETLAVQAGRAGHDVELLRDVQNMREQYDWCDLCVASAGNTALELACVGVASLFLIIVDNQEPVARAIRKFGFGRVLGWHEDVNEDAIRAGVRDLLVSTEERDRMGRWGRKVVDGQGALRVATALGKLV